MKDINYSNDLTAMSIFIIPSNINPDAARKPGKIRRRESRYRHDKSIGHKTINGIGVIGKLRKSK